VNHLRYAVRLVRRDPGYAAVAILTMAPGIGVTTMLFSVAYGVLIKPLPWPDADRIMRLIETWEGHHQGGRFFGGLAPLVRVPIGCSADLQVRRVGQA
jgi:hypothetical protein